MFNVQYNVLSNEKEKYEIPTRRGAFTHFHDYEQAASGLNKKSENTFLFYNVNRRQFIRFRRVV